MKLIAGLGNPGRRYAQSRHNIGFMVVDELARRWSTDVSRYDGHFEGQFGQGQAHGEQVFLLKPSTFMNLSGRSVAAVWRYYKLAPGDVLIVHDDLDLAVGQLRVRASGSGGGHKGLTDVIRHFGTNAVPRLRIGIGKTQRAATVDHVLGRFAPDERSTIAVALIQAADAAECWLRSGVAAAMNQFNRRQDDESGGPSRPRDSRSEGDSS